MPQSSAKKELIDKSMMTMVTVVAVAVFLTVFSLVSAHSLWNKLTFQNKVISAKTTARDQLNRDISAASELNSSYASFDVTKTNLLGGTVSGIDTDNAKIVLDALPSVYDYPALTTSIQNLLSNQGVNIDSIGGSDQSASNTSSSSPSSNSPQDMPFTFSIDGPYQNIQNAITTFEKSIRPFQFQTLDFSGNQSDITLTVTAQTFFQPATSFSLKTETIQ